MKPDERYFLKRMQLEVGLAPFRAKDKTSRDIIGEDGFPLHIKRAWYLLKKWHGKGWYEYGVTLDLGWMTEEGMKVEI